LSTTFRHNGRVGQWGISYPGFFTQAGAIDSHPALKAVSPQAPVSDFWGDDSFHNGAFYLIHNFRFFGGFGRIHTGLVTEMPERPKYLDAPDAYQFFLDIGPLKNANTMYFRDNVPYWNEMLEHPSYDAFWQAKNIIPHLKNITAAVMMVGGWFDCEDLYGPLKAYHAIEKNNPGIFNVLVMGPWQHGGWSGTGALRWATPSSGSPPRPGTTTISSSRISSTTSWSRTRNTPFPRP